MNYHLLIAAATPDLARTIRRSIYQLGGIGFIPLGLLDNSIFPVPGSMDLLTIILSARKQELWPYYAFMAIIGSIIGGYVTYRLARKGGRKALERRFHSLSLERAYKSFERWGFGAVALAALLPPPVPITPSLLAAGAMQFPVRKFLTALAAGRAIRYTLLAFLSARYGRRIIAGILKFGHPVPLAIFAVIAVAALIFLYFYAGERQTPAKS